MGYCVPVYLINLGTQNFFGTTIFGTRHISTAYTKLYKFTPSIALILASSVVILSWSMSSNDLVLWDSLANSSIITRAGAGVADYTNAGLCWGSWPCSPILSLGWAIIGGLNCLVTTLHVDSIGVYKKWLGHSVTIITK